MVNKKVKVIAHRCGMARAPENTLLGCKTALQDGADGFECDARLTKDGEPVVIHTVFGSDDITKAADCTTPLSGLTWLDVKRLKVKGTQESVPHLDDVLAFVAENSIECYIEPKEDSPALIEKIVQRAEQWKLSDKIRFITFFRLRRLLIRAKNLNPNIKTDVILISPFVDWRECARSAQADIVTPGWKRLNWWKGSRLVTSRFSNRVMETHDAGIEVTSGIANVEKDTRWLIEQGVDGIWTDDVVAVKRVLEN